MERRQMVSILSGHFPVRPERKILWTGNNGLLKMVAPEEGPS